MKIILTGTGGLLGRHITAELQKNSSYEIIAATSDPHKLENTYADCKNVYVVSNNELFQRDWDYGKADIWINCLYPMSYDGRSIADGLRLISDMLKIIPEHVDYCIDISSQSVYDCKRLEPASEQSPISLSDSYAVGKYTIEQLFDARCGNKCVHIRLASLIGADFERRFINKFIDKVLNNEDINISGGSQLFGFMDVRDAADGIVMMVNAINNSNTSPLTPIWGGQAIYNLGTNKAHSLKEIAEIIVRLGKKYGYSPEIDICENGEWYNSSLDCSFFMKEFGWKPKLSIEDTIDGIYKSKIK